MATTKSTGTLIAQWAAKDGAFRLVACGEFTAGYEDTYVLEKLAPDALGAERWVEEDRWSNNASVDGQRTLYLTNAIKALSEDLSHIRRRMQQTDLPEEGTKARGQLIPGIDDPPERFEALARLLAAIPGDTMLDLLDGVLMLVGRFGPLVEDAEVCSLRAWMLTILQREFIDPDAWCGRLPPKRTLPDEPRVRRKPGGPDRW